jgi:hypothetical protein
MDPKMRYLRVTGLQSGADAQGARVWRFAWPAQGAGAAGGASMTAARYLDPTINGALHVAADHLGCVG